MRPYISFNKKGNLLAVSANDNQIKILANDHGRELLQTSAVDYGDSSGCEELQQSSAFVSGDASRYLTESFRQVSNENSKSLYNLLAGNVFYLCSSTGTAFCKSDVCAS